METATTDETIVGVRVLITSDGHLPDDRYPIPDKQEFKRAGQGVIRAHDLGTIGRALIDADEIPLGHLAGLKISYLWLERGGMTGGFPTLGSLHKETDVERHFSGFDYLVKLSADHLKTMKATRWQVEGLIAHQLGHIAVEKTKKGENRYGIKGHDFEGHGFEFKRYGVYLPGQVSTGEVISDVYQAGFVWQERPDDDYDPSVDLPAGAESEAGPADGGAPEAGWADVPDWEAMAKQDDPDFVRAESVRKNLGTTVNNDGQEVCRACGVDVFDHDPEFCRGGMPETRRDAQKNSVKMPPRRGRKGSAETDTEKSQPVLGHPGAPSGQPVNGLNDSANHSTLVYSASANGGHDRAAAAGILLDPDRVCQTLTERGWKIAAEGMVADLGEGDWTYVDPETGEQYETATVESAYRAALAGSRDGQIRRNLA